MIYHWINLTNGLQAIHDHDLVDFRVMRLQSTYCEQKRWEDILFSIPDEFLFRAALGEECRVYDYGARKTIPRAVWQGLEWVKYVFHRRWKDEVLELSGRASTMESYFNEQYNKLSKRCKARLDYFKPMFDGNIYITSITDSTQDDGDKEKMMSYIGVKPLTRKGIGK